MPYKDLLVYADSRPECAVRVELACALAARHRAHLTALHVMMPWPVPAFVEAGLPRDVHEMRDRTLHEIAERVEKSVQGAARTAGIEVEWTAQHGELPEAVMARARCADVTVLGQVGDEGPDDPLERGLLEALLMGSGRPLLIVPRYGKFPRLGERVLVAWNGTREAARAVNDALPILVEAREVTVLTVNPPGDSPRDVPAGDIALHLARHGVKATAASLRADDLAVGDLLLSRASDLGADLIVMGGYGHSRLREMALGGATRHLLRHMTVPVLLSH